MPFDTSDRRAISGKNGVGRWGKTHNVILGEVYKLCKAVCLKMIFTLGYRICVGSL